LKETENRNVVWQKVIEQAKRISALPRKDIKKEWLPQTEVLDAPALLTKAKSEYANALGDYNVNSCQTAKSHGNYLAVSFCLWIIVALFILK